MKYPTYLKLNDFKLITFVRRNPGNTAMCISKCLNRKCGTVSSMLSKIVKKGLLKKELGMGLRSNKKNTWRYFPL